MSISEKQVLAALSHVNDPDLNRDIVSLGFIKNLKISGGNISLDINLTTPACPVKDLLKSQAEAEIRKISGVTSVAINMTAEVRRTVEPDKTNIAGIKNFVAVASGKGGVGKSTVAVNLAVAMAQAGAKVGLLDADIYGPTVPLMMGPEAQIDMGPNDQIIPTQAHGIKFMSMGFMAPGDKPLIWRGPMAHHALQQCLYQVMWGDLDYLFLDLPPGTGDVHLTLAQSVKLTGAVLVSTPQDIGLTISLKTYQMFKTTNVKILGIIENMSYHICTHCFEREEIFGHGGAEAAAKKLDIPFLGAIPLDIRIRANADQGIPMVTADPNSPISQTYKKIVQQLASQVSIASYAAPSLQIVEEPA